MVLTSIGSEGGIDNALGLWGFVLAVVSVLLGIGGLLLGPRDDAPGKGVQVNYSEQGDVFGSMNGNQYVHRTSSKRGKQGQA